MWCYLQEVLGGNKADSLRSLLQNADILKMFVCLHRFKSSSKLEGQNNAEAHSAYGV